MVTTCVLQLQCRRHISCYDTSPIQVENVGTLETSICQIPNPKHQITNKFKIQNTNDQNRFGISKLDHSEYPIPVIVVIYLEFQIIANRYSLTGGGKKKKGTLSPFFRCHSGNRFYSMFRVTRAQQGPGRPALSLTLSRSPAFVQRYF